MDNETVKYWLIGIQIANIVVQTAVVAVQGYVLYKINKNLEITRKNNDMIKGLETKVRDKLN